MKRVYALVKCNPDYDMYIDYVEYIFSDKEQAIEALSYYEKEYGNGSYTIQEFDIIDSKQGKKIIQKLDIRDKSL